MVGSHFLTRIWILGGLELDLCLGAGIRRLCGRHDGSRSIQEGTDHKGSYKTGERVVTGPHWHLRTKQKSDVPGAASLADGVGELSVKHTERGAAGRVCCIQDTIPDQAGGAGSAREVRSSLSDVQTTSHTAVG